MGLSHSRSSKLDLTYGGVDKRKLHPEMQRTIRDMQRKDDLKNGAAVVTGSFVKDNLNAAVAAMLGATGINPDVVDTIIEAGVDPLTTTLIDGGVYGLISTRENRMPAMPKNQALPLLMTLSRNGDDPFVVLDDVRQRLQMSLHETCIDTMNRAGHAVEKMGEHLFKNVVPPRLYQHVEHRYRLKTNGIGRTSPPRRAFIDHIPPVIAHLAKPSTATGIAGAIVGGGLGGIAGAAIGKFAENAGLGEGAIQLLKNMATAVASIPGNMITATSVMDIRTDRLNAYED